MRALPLVVLLLPFALARCTCAVTPVPSGGDAGPDSGPDDAGVGPQDAFDVWREMQAVLRQSDDHRIAKAERLVAARDVDALFAFVQHETALIPGPGGFYGSDVTRRWGTRGTLRGGMGTMRERADLLAELLTRAGFTARVVVGVPRADFSLEDSLAQGPVRAVSWAASAATRNTWRTVLHTAAPDTDRVRFDPDGVTQQQIADALLALLPTPRADAPLDLGVTAIPLVRVTRDGATTDLNPNVVTASATDPQVDDIVDAAEAWPTEQLTVRLEAARAQTPAERFVLVEHTWNAEDVVGRTITAAFAPPMSFAQAAVTPISDVDTLVPYLLVKGADVPRADRAALSAVGTPITRGGETVAVAETGILNFGDGDITPPPTAAAQLAAAHTVNAQVDAAAFPQVQVAVRVNDVDGARVSGLAADAFTVQEDGVPVAAAVRRTVAPAPKLLLLFDRSSSIPVEFLDDAAAAGHAIAAEVFAQVPGAQVAVGGLDFAAPTMAGGFVDTLDAVDAQLAALTGSASEVWENLAAASALGATAVVCISDFVADDAYSRRIGQAIANGPPIFAVGVGSADAATATRVATLSGGTVELGLAVDDVALAAGNFLQLHTGFDYAFVYRSQAAALSAHTVTVGVDSSRISATADYTAPAAPERAPALSGLYLTLETAGRTLTRTLAGGTLPDATDDDIAAVQGMLFGRALVAVEAGPPSLSEKLDEQLGERLVDEPLVDAFVAGDTPAFQQARNAPRTRTPARLRFAFSTGKSEATGPATYPDGLNLALFVERPQFGGPLVRALDLLPLIEKRTALLDQQQAFAATVERTAYSAAIEARLFASSTHALLQGETLVPIDPITVDADLGPGWIMPIQDYTARYALFGPSDGTPHAFWAIADTGSALGGLADGSGGAIEDEAQQTLAEVERILDAAERVSEAAGFEGITVWVELERIKAALVVNATVVIAGGAGQDPADVLTDAACSAAEGGITGEIPGFDEATGPVDDLGTIADIAEGATGTEMPDVGLPSACD